MSFYSQDLFTIGGSLGTKQWCDLFEKTHQMSAIGITCSTHHSDNVLVFEFELPGVARKDIEIRFERGYLKVSAARARHGKATPLYASIKITSNVDVNKGTATLQDGILTVTLPKARGELPVKIAVT